MKTLKYILLAIVALAGFAACSDDDTEPANGINGSGVYFPVNAPQTVMLAEGQNQVSVQILRSVSSEELTTRVLYAPDEAAADIFSVNSTVRFAAGESSANIDITFDYNDIEPGTKYAMSLSLADEGNTSSYGKTVYSFNILYDPWDDLGEATFYDYFFFDNGYKVPVQRKSGTTDMFRLVDPYGPGLKAEGPDLKSAGLGVGTPDEYLEFRVLANGLVIYNPCTTGLLYQGTSDILIYHPYSVGMDDQSLWACNCELMEGVYQLAPYYYVPDAQGGWDHTQTEGVILIVMPGASLDFSDYSISSEFKGTYTSPDQSEMSALIDVKIGEDVAQYKYAVTEGDLSGSEEELMAFALGIADGSVESETGTKSETLRLALEFGGDYTFVAVSFDAQGAPQLFTHTVFEFVTGSRLTPDQFTAEISVPKKDESSATIRIAPVANYIAYEWGVASKTSFEESVAKFGSYDKYRLDLFERVAEQSGITIAELLEQTGIVVKGSEEETIENLPSETELVVWAYAIDKTTGKGLSEVTTYGFVTDPMPELIPEYEKWLGVWTVTSASSWNPESAASRTFDIVIDVKKANKTFRVYEWGPNVIALEDMWQEYVPFVADFNNGELEIYSQEVASLTNGGTISLLPIAPEYTSLWTQIGAFVMSGTLTGETTARISDPEGKVAGFDYFVLSGGKIGFIDTGDTPTGPFTLVKKPAAETASVKKHGLLNDNRDLNQLNAALRKNAGRQPVADDEEISVSRAKSSGNSLPLSAKRFSGEAFEMLR